jgi:hypothetical protein
VNCSVPVPTPVGAVVLSHRAEDCTAVPSVIGDTADTVNCCDSVAVAPVTTPGKLKITPGDTVTPVGDPAVTYSVIFAVAVDPVESVTTTLPVYTPDASESTELLACTCRQLALNDWLLCGLKALLFTVSQFPPAFVVKLSL